jgi:hypothetical protein
MTEKNNKVIPLGKRNPHAGEMWKKSVQSRLAKRDEVGFKPGEYDEKTRWAQLCDGEITVQDLDTEELTRMRCRDKLGGWTGRPSHFIPRKLEAEMREELLKRGQRDLENALPIAVKALAEICAKGYGKDRISAATLLLERALGKVPDKVDLTTHTADPWEDLLQNVIVTEQELKALSQAQEGQANAG